MDISVNNRAVEIVQQLLDDQEALGCTADVLKNGTTVIDAGIGVPGSREAGRLVSEVTLGGLGVVRLLEMHIDDLTLPAVIVSTDAPSVATLGCQFAGWQVKKDDFIGMGSGPARVHSRHEKIHENLAYHDDVKTGVIVLESRVFPNEKVTQHIADICRISPSDLYCIVAPTASTVGSVQIAARVVTIGMHKLYMLGYDPEKVRKAHGTAPIAPVADDDNTAMGRTNDCILYGGRVYFFIRPEEGDDLAALASKMPSAASDKYGLSFSELFKSFEFDFYSVDKVLFSPAEVTLNNITTGETHCVGELNAQVLRKSLEL
jgi:methenyltetrahydromethanopterin cyclohydrolase